MPGTVYLVGAGPGDPGLMTRRSLELIAAADAVLYDRLIPPGALDGARGDAQLIYVGKQPGGHSMAQEEINARLVELGRELRTVVRLKGGDPFVFGRGGEEAQALADAGVPFEVVPGVTAGVAAPAYAGIPVTHRDAASAVAFVTGHEDPEKPDTALDWPALASFPGTLVLYMGVGMLEQIAQRLIESGRPEDEPVAVIERGTLPGQRTVTSTLGGITTAVTDAGITPARHHARGPGGEAARAAPLVGAASALRPHRGGHAREGAGQRAVRSVGAARCRGGGDACDPDRGAAGERRAARGGRGDRRVRVGVPDEPERRGAADGRAGRLGGDARALARATVAAIGPGTAAELQHRGIRADVVPERSVAEALLEALEAVPLEGRRVLVARATEARDVLPDGLRERGAEVDVVALYETVAEPLSEDQREAAARADYVTFTSSSTVRNYIEAGGSVGAEARVISIGPVTSATARELGLTVHVEAAQHDIEGLVTALLGDATGS